MTLTIYLVRHGDTEWSPMRRLAGRVDLPLTAVGEANASKLAPRLASVAFDRVYTSPLVRGHAAWALGEIGAAAREDSIQVLRCASEHDADSFVREEAAFALARLLEVSP